MGGLIMKQFNLKEYLENPSRQVVTRNGFPVRIICTDAKDTYPVIGLVKLQDGTEYTNCFKKNGKHSDNYGFDSPLDLFFVSVKKEGWVNLYDTRINGKMCTSSVFDTKEEAVKNIGLIDTGRFDLVPDYISTVHIEWEEEE